MLTFNEAADAVTISASTTLGRGSPGRRADQMDEAREALLAGRDEWSARCERRPIPTASSCSARTAAFPSSTSRRSAENLQNFSLTRR